VSPRHLASLGTAALAVAIVGCGSDDKGTEEGSRATAVAAEVDLDGKRVSLNAPPSVKAGVVTLRLANSAQAPIGVEIIRVDGNQTAAEVVKQIGMEQGPIPGWIHGAGGAGVAPPGGRASGTQILKPGTHYLIAERDDEDLPPATAKLEVTGEVPAQASLPAADARITADEYSFRASGLKAGTNKIKFENVGKELHHAIAFPIKRGAPLAKVKRFFKSKGKAEGPPPLDFEASVSTPVLDGKEAQTIDLKLKRGRYALVCFIPDRAGSPPHVALGMLNEVAVK